MRESRHFAVHGPNPLFAGAYRELAGKARSADVTVREHALSVSFPNRNTARTNGSRHREKDLLGAPLRCAPSSAIPGGEAGGRRWGGATLGRSEAGAEEAASSEESGFHPCLEGGVRPPPRSPMR